ncbi:MAG: VOC family protein [bacterium]
MSATIASPAVSSLAPVLIVDAVEPCLAFWRDRLGFTAENEVPGDDGALIFASVKKGAVEIMYQTRSSVIADLASRAGELTGNSTGLFIEVPTLADLDLAEKATAGAPVVKARHETFYGMTEFYVREPGGNVVGFASKTS